MVERNGTDGGPLDRPAMPQEEAEISPPTASSASSGPAWSR